MIDLYRKQDHNIHEHVLSAINVLIDDNPEAINQAAKKKDFSQEINFKQILNERLEQTKGDSRYDEERDMAKRILQNLFQN